jgi:SAUR family protein
MQQIVRKLRNLLRVRKAAQVLCCKLLFLRSCLDSYVSDDDHFNIVAGKNYNNRHRWSVSAVPQDVPPGHMAVYVGRQYCERFVIRAAYLNHPVFRLLLEQAEEEFAHARQDRLVIPCDKLLFKHILSLFNRKDHAGVRNLDLEAVKNNFCNECRCSAEAEEILLGKDSRPLLYSFAEE